jgi:hypothetical protein
MTVKICTYCHKKFECSRYHPDQQVCSSKECQRRRRTDYHRKKIQDDPVYREQCLDSQRKWRERNPDYMQRYLFKRLKKSLCESEISKLVREQRLFGINENNVAMNLRPLTASIWLIYRRNECQEENIFAHAKLVALHGTLYAVFVDKDKEHLFESRLETPV